MCFPVIAGGDLSSQIAAHGLETPGFPACGHPAEFNGCGILMAIGGSTKTPTNPASPVRRLTLEVMFTL
jgi:hypothetical protein